MIVTLCLSCSLVVGVNSIGAFRGPPRSGVAFPTTSGLYCLEVCWKLHRGFPRPPSVGCGLPYHISSLTLWESAGNCIGGFLSAPSVGCGLPYHICSLTLWGPLATALGFPRSPSVGCGLPYHISSLTLGSLLATASGVAEVPLGRVWPSLPHLVSNPLGVCWQLLWHPKLNWVK